MNTIVTSSEVFQQSDKVICIDDSIDDTCQRMWCSEWIKKGQTYTVRSVDETPCRMIPIIRLVGIRCAKIPYQRREGGFRANRFRLVRREAGVSIA